MLHPDAMLSKTMFFTKYRHRRQCASPARATLGAEPNLFVPKGCILEVAPFRGSWDELRWIPLEKLV